MMEKSPLRATQLVHLILDLIIACLLASGQAFAGTYLLQDSAKQKARLHLIAACEGSDRQPPCSAQQEGDAFGGRGFFWSPGLYQNFEGDIGGELSVIHGVFGLAAGIQTQGVSYLEAEMIFGPLSIGFGPRLSHGRVTAQTTIALPFFYFFPYWRWFTADEGDKKQTREFGLMLKFPLGRTGRPDLRNGSDAMLKALDRHHL